jgi:hypothetical protein
MKLAKINAERTKLEQDFANVVTELVTNFWPEILTELL